MKLKIKNLISGSVFILSLSFSPSLFAKIGDTVEESVFDVEKPENSMTLFIYPPRKELDYSSPKKMLKTFISVEVGKRFVNSDPVYFTSDFGERGSIKSHYISTVGHSISWVDCQLPNGDRFNKWASFSGQDYAEVDKRLALKEKIGMGVLFYDYVDGHIISGMENLKRITHYKGGKIADITGEKSRARPRFMSFSLDAEQCQSVKDMIVFFEAFHFKAGTPIAELEARDDAEKLYFTSTMDPYETYLNRMNDPNSKVGGGCAPFVVSLMKIAGLYDEKLDDDWKMGLSVSERLIGGDNPLNTVSEVPLIDVYLKKLGNHWNYENYENRSMSVYDPLKIWRFVGEVQECLSGEGRTSNKCSSVAQDWIESQQQEVVKGKTMKFMDLVKQSFDARPREDSYFTKKVTMNVEGIVIK